MFSQCMSINIKLLSTEDSRTGSVALRCMTPASPTLLQSDLWLMLADTFLDGSCSRFKTTVKSCYLLNNQSIGFNWYFIIFIGLYNVSVFFKSFYVTKSSAYISEDTLLSKFSFKTSFAMLKIVVCRINVMITQLLYW